MKPEAVNQLYAEYAAVHGAEPDEEEECTGEQLACLSAVIKGGGVPFADFAVWGPYANRAVKRRYFSGQVMGPGGKWTQVEAYGPSSFPEWSACWQVYATAMYMLGAVSMSTLKRYYKLIQRQSNLYGDEAWMLIYQTEHRSRLEQLERIRRRLAAEHGQRLAAGMASTFDPERPWDACFLALIADRDWWHYQLETRAMMQKVDRMAEDAHVDGDFVTGKVAKRPRGDGKKAADNAGGAPPKKQAKTEQEHARDLSQRSEGKFTHNRKGNPICAQFNAGQCQTAAHTKCPQGSHQCSNCLVGTHPSTSCTKGAAKGGDKGAWRAQKGQGKGRGAGKGQGKPWR